MSFPGFPAPPSPGAPSTPTTHDLLSATHTDTIAASGQFGDLVSANSSGNWTRLAVGSESEVLTVVGGQPEWAAASGGGSADVSILTHSLASGTTYNVGDEVFVGVTSGVSTVAMPPAPIFGRQVIVKDIDGVASTSNITISGSGNNIDGDPTVLLNINFQSITMVFNERSEWSIV